MAKTAAHTCQQRMPEELKDAALLQRQLLSSILAVRAFAGVPASAVGGAAAQAAAGLSG
jgi:hypothetical protein